MLVVDMAEEDISMETFNMEGLEMVWEENDAKESGVEVFHINELA